MNLFSLVELDVETRRRLEFEKPYFCIRISTTQKKKLSTFAQLEKRRLFGREKKVTRKKQKKKVLKNCQFA
jgi:rRNA processing protein Gar1